MEYHKKFTWNLKESVKVQEVRIEELQEQNELLRRQALDAKVTLVRAMQEIAAVRQGVEINDFDTFKFVGGDITVNEYVVDEAIQRLAVKIDSLCPDLTLGTGRAEDMETVQSGGAPSQQPLAAAGNETAEIVTPKPWYAGRILTEDRLPPVPSSTNDAACDPISMGVSVHTLTDGGMEEVVTGGIHAW